MSTNDRFERRFRADLAGLLEQESLPHPTWTDSPAAVRVEAEAVRRRRWPLRVLAVAALLVVGGTAAAVGGAWLLERAPTIPPPTQPALIEPQSSDPAKARADGWVAYGTGWEIDSDIMFVRPGERAELAIGTPGDGVGQSCPAFSPDGRFVAYVEMAENAPSWAVVVAELGADGRPGPSVHRFPVDEAVEEKRLQITTADFASGEGAARCPRWSPDGTHVAVLTASGIRVADRRNGSSSPLVTITDFVVGDFAWAPDSNGVAYARNAGPAGETSELWFAPLSGEQSQLVGGTSGERIHRLDWAADGRLAIAGAFSRVTLSENSVTVGGGDGFARLLDVANRASRPVELSGRSDVGVAIRGLTWSPAGDAVAYIEGANALTVQVHGSPGRLITLEVNGQTVFAGCLDGWSPSGDRLLVLGYENGLDEPRLGQSILLSVDPQGRSDPVIVRGWDRDMWGVCGVASWQPTSAGQLSEQHGSPAASLEPSPTFASRRPTPDPTSTPRPVASGT